MIGSKSDILPVLPRRVVSRPCFACRAVGSQRQELTACSMSHYKFILAVENTVKPQYVTEKALEPLDAGTAVHLSFLLLV